MTLEFHNRVGSRETLSKRAFGVLAATGVNLSEYERIRLDAMQVVEAHDVHGYYSLSGRGIPERIGGAAVSGVILHVQVYPGMSDNESMEFMARFMDKRQFVADRAQQNNTSLGNERAVIAPLLEGRPLADSLPWSARSLTDLIVEGLAN